MVKRVLNGEIGGTRSSIDKRYVRPDGSVIWANSRATLLPDQDGQPGNLLVVTVDVSDRKLAERAAQESEALLRQFGHASSNALWIINAETLEWEYLSPAFDRIYGVDRGSILKDLSLKFIYNLILPEDLQATRKAFSRLHEEPGEYAYRIRRSSDGEIRWLRTTGFQIVDSDGIVRRLAGITFDMTEEKHIADRMEVLVSELQHRTRNLIALVRAIASRTLKSSQTFEEFLPRFDERLQALARVNGLLSKLDEGERLTFDELLMAELAGHGLVDDGRLALQVTLDGPTDVRLPSAAVQTLALALHELLTNAEKHGALRGPDGRLVIKWRLIGDEGSRLSFDWLETGIKGWQDRSTNTVGSGYGRELIERALPYQLGAETSYKLDDTELRCTIIMPVAKRKGREGDS